MRETLRMTCDHEWRVTYYGPTGSTHTEEECTKCGAERVSGLLNETSIQLAALKVNAALVSAANSPKR